MAKGGYRLKNTDSAEFSSARDYESSLKFVNSLDSAQEQFFFYCAPKNFGSTTRWTKPTGANHPNAVIHPRSTITMLNMSGRNNIIITRLRRRHDAANTILTPYARNPIKLFG